jgi:hypothetical protein
VINAELHKQPTVLDTVKHRQLRIDTDASAVARYAHFASSMITFQEFGACSREFPILFVQADKDENTGKPQVAPVAMFGMGRGENLFIEDNQWTGEYVPSQFRTYPFTLARIDDQNWAVVFDAEWKGIQVDGPGEALFDAEGKATPFLQNVHRFTQDVESDIERTRLGGQRLLELELLKPMRFDATLNDGSKVSLDGFLTIDEDKFSNLPDAAVVELHRSGLLGLMHLHRLSLVNMARLLQRKAKRAAAAGTPAAANS